MAELAVEISDEMGDCGRRPEDNRVFQDLRHRGCRMWRLLVVTDDRRDVPQQGPPPPPSLYPPPYKNGELIIVCKCGDLGKDRYASIPSDRSFSVSISQSQSSMCVHWITQSVQHALSLSLRAFRGLIPHGHMAELAVEISDEMSDRACKPQGNREFQYLCSRGCRMWRLIPPGDVPGSDNGFS